ncbi:aspartate/glutamate racemase family protein [Sphingomonas sp. NFX23]|uniref:aspartate/glutamate racemase family protein n=1 Tax=Sphingomonas sp. NFX23 TaxID=2819532 RepID=UPI003CE92E00
MRVALIHALRESVTPINAAFDAHWPEASRMNVLDDSLSADRARDGQLSDALIERFLVLGRYVRDAGADAILFTCSAFGPAIDAVAADLRPLPVHKPNTAMIAAAGDFGRVGLLASFAPTLESMVREFNSAQTVVTCHCGGALEALQAGNGDEHDRIAAEAAITTLSECDVIALAQFSLARAAKKVAQATGKPVLTTPECAVLSLRAEMLK